MKTTKVDKPAKERSYKWDDRMYVTIYELVKEGHKMKEVAEILGVGIQTLQKWVKENEALKEAVAKAKAMRKSVAKSETFMEYIYKTLSPKVQDIWDKLMEFDETDNTIRRMDILIKQPEKIRQQLFIHALVCSRFDPTEACRRTGITKHMYETWCITDPGFARLVEEVMWHKKNFFESALVRLVEEGNTSATIFANKTINRDRGYDQRSEVHHSGAVLHGQVDIETLNLPREAKRELLKAMRLQLAMQLEEDERHLVVIDHPPIERKEEEDDDDAVQ